MDFKIAMVEMAVKFQIIHIERFKLARVYCKSVFCVCKC